MTDVTPAETYWFKVLAVNLVGSGPLSDGVSRIAASAPSAPVDLAMIQQSTTSITFSWVKNGNNGGSSVTDYAVYWNQGSGNVQYEVIGSNGLLPTEATIQSPILLAESKERSRILSLLCLNPDSLCFATWSSLKHSSFEHDITNDDRSWLVAEHTVRLWWHSAYRIRSLVESRSHLKFFCEVQ
jgi:hypothetical protein